MRRSKLTREPSNGPSGESKSKSQAPSLPPLDGTAAATGNTPRKQRGTRKPASGPASTKQKNAPLLSTALPTPPKLPRASADPASLSRMSHRSILDAEPDTPLDDATGDEIEEEETLRRFLARAPQPKPQHHVWSFHPAQKDEVVTSFEAQQEIPERIDAEVDAEARAVLAVADGDIYEEDWTTITPDVEAKQQAQGKRVAKKRREDATASAVNQSSDAAAEQSTPSQPSIPALPIDAPSKPSDIPATERKASQKSAAAAADSTITAAATDVVNNSPGKLRRKLSQISTNSDSQPTSPGTGRIKRQISATALPLPPAPTTPLLPDRAQPASVTSTPRSPVKRRADSVSTAGSDPAAVQAATTGGWMANASPGAVTRQPSMIKPPSASSSAAASSTASAAQAMIVSLQQQLASAQQQSQQSHNQLTAKNLKLNTMQKEKDSLQQELLQLRESLDKEKLLRQQSIRSASAASMTSAGGGGGTMSLPQQQHKVALQSKRLTALQDELSAARLKINTLSLSLDSARRRLRLKIGRDLPPGVVRTLQNQRALIEELKKQLAAEGEEGGEKQAATAAMPVSKQQLLESQHTIAEQSALIDSLQAELVRVTKEKQQLQKDLGHGALLQAESKFFDASTPLIAATPRVADPASMPAEDAPDPLADSADETSPSSPRNSATAYAGGAGAEAVRRELARAAVQVPPPASASRHPKSPRAGVNANEHSPSNSSPAAASIAAQASSVSVASDPSFIRLTQALATAEAALRQERSSSASALATMSGELRSCRTLLEQYESRHVLSDRLAKSQYSQLIALTKEYHARGEIMHALTSRLKAAQEELEWMRREVEASKDPEGGYDPVDEEEEASWQQEQQQMWEQARQQQRQQQHADTHRPPSGGTSRYNLHSIEERKEGPSFSSLGSTRTPQPRPPSGGQLHLLHQPSSSSASPLPTISSVLAASPAPPVPQPMPTASPAPAAPTRTASHPPRASQLLLASLARVHLASAPAYPDGFAPPGPASAAVSPMLQASQRLEPPQQRTTSMPAPKVSAQSPAPPIASPLALTALSGRSSGSWKDYKRQTQLLQTADSAQAQV